MATLVVAEPPSPYSYNRPSSGFGGSSFGGSSFGGSSFGGSSFGGSSFEVDTAVVMAVVVTAVVDSNQTKVLMSTHNCWNKFVKFCCVKKANPAQGPHHLHNTVHHRHNMVLHHNHLPVLLPLNSKTLFHQSKLLHFHNKAPLQLHHLDTHTQHQV